MTLGAILLAHERLDRAADLALALAAEGVTVAVHVDARAPAACHAAFEARTGRAGGLLAVPRRACDWGMFSIVRATLDAAALLLARAPGLSHVALLSGSCLPVRPVAELRAFLAASGRTDFIESVDVGARRWVQGGLAEERFTLHFPFSWRRQRWLFDRSVALQRRLGIRRRIPEGLVPHIGSQWWCLTRETLAAILADPRRAEFEAYFARTWIPDETFFQTLVRRHAVRIESRSLTFSRFDHQGKPHVFYEDHAGLLEASDCFFARKIWPGAEGLYRRWLAPGRPARRGAEFRPRLPERPFREAARQRCEGRPGFLTQGRFPCRWHEAQPAAPRRYTVFEGFDALAPGWHRALGALPGHSAHGRLFAPDRVDFADGGPVSHGNLPAVPRIRDRAPEQFLLSLLRADPAPSLSFQLSALDGATMAGFVRRDPKARLLRIEHGWLIDLFAATGGDAARARPAYEALRREAAWPQGAARAEVTVWPLAEAVADPARVLRAAIAALAPEARPVLPEPARLEGLATFAAALGYPGAEAIAEAARARAVREALWAEDWPAVAAPGGAAG